MFISRSKAAIAAVGALAATGGGVALAATSASTSPHTSGTGTITITGPAGRTHTRSGEVVCRTADGRYLARTVSRRNHARLVVRVTARSYTGPGSYRAHVVLIRRRGAAFRGRVLRVPVTITATGGSFDYSRTLSGIHNHALKGKTVSVRASWTCSA